MSVLHLAAACGGWPCFAVATPVCEENIVHSLKSTTKVVQANMTVLMLICYEKKTSFVR
jgi:hypothetical protein